MAPEPDLLDQLELLKTDLGSLARSFGPEMILMMTSIGTSHLVTAPVAGGRFEYALAWCLPAAAIHRHGGRGRPSRPRAVLDDRQSRQALRFARGGHTISVTRRAHRRGTGDCSRDDGRSNQSRQE